MTSQTNPIFHIANGNTVSSEYLDIHGNDVVGFYTPSALTSTAITFQAASDLDQTFVAVKDSGGSAISFTVAVSGYYGFSQDQICKFRGIRYLKLIAGSAEGAARQIPMCLVPRSAF